jgi:hypothetical protein
MRSIYRFATEHTSIYLAICVAAGLTGRLYLAHGNLGLFFNPMFPIFLR